MKYAVGILIAALGLAGCGEYVSTEYGYLYMRRSEAEAYRAERRVERADREAKWQRAFEGLLDAAGSLDDFQALAELAVNEEATRYFSFHELTDKLETVAFRRREWYRDTHPELPLSVSQSIRRGEVSIGLNTEQVRASWGEPKDTNRTVTAHAVHEQWVYHSRSLYFDDGVLTSWQD